MKGPISQFIEKHYLHFNAAALVDAAKGYETHLTECGKMMVTLAGAMSTAELGKSLAEMIRAGKVDIISCTGANLEEDIMNLVAHNHYKRVPHYRDLSPQDEWDLLENHYNRVTDTCIPEEEAFRRLQKHIHKIWKDADSAGERYFPHEYMYKILLSGELKQYYEIDPKDSWMIAAAERLSAAFVTRIARLALLAPDVQIAILNGTAAPSVRLEALREEIPAEWEHQRRQLMPTGS